MKRYNLFTMKMVALNIGSVLMMVGLLIITMFVSPHISLINLNMGLFLAIAIVYFGLHEVIHGIFYYLFGAHLDKITFGVHLEKGILCCSCKENISKKNILASALAPFIILGVLAYMLGLVFSNDYLVFLAIMNMAGSIGDLVMFFCLRRLDDFEFSEYDNPLAFALYTDLDLSKEKMWGLKYLKTVDNLERTVKKRVVVSKLSKVVLGVLFMFFALYLLYYFNFIPHMQYLSEDFGIVSYKSKVDMDGDGLDDATDILQNARDYVALKPKYKSKYYANGYPDDGYGVCTDVVAVALKNAGYDLKTLVTQNIKAHQELYDVEEVDENIDFRRVSNLKVYFDNQAISLTNNIYNLAEWQGGDIVVFKKHIGIVSDKRNYKGIPFIIHHSGNLMINYEEDILERRHDIIGHYRIS